MLLSSSFCAALALMIHDQTGGAKCLSLLQAGRQRFLCPSVASASEMHEELFKHQLPEPAKQEIDLPSTFK